MTKLHFKKWLDANNVKILRYKHVIEMFSCRQCKLSKKKRPLVGENYLQYINIAFRSNTAQPTVILSQYGVKRGASTYIYAHDMGFFDVMKQRGRFFLLQLPQHFQIAGQLIDLFLWAIKTYTQISDFLLMRSRQLYPIIIIV